MANTNDVTMVEEPFGRAIRGALEDNTVDNKYDMRIKGSANNPIPIEVGDSASADAFGRLRVSNTTQRLDVEFLYDKQDEYFDEQTNNGTVTHNTNSRDLTLSLSDANNGSYAWMSSYPVPYTPGNSQLIDITGVLDLANIGGGTAEVFLRTTVSGSTTTTTEAQADWDNATSGVDWADSHIFAMDFQSLKVGRIRFGLVQNGVYVPVHSISNDNVRNTGYWQLPNLPVYYKLYTDSGNTYMELGYGDASNAIGFRYVISANASATMKAICCTVKSEGGPELLDLSGLARATNRGISAYTVSTTLVPVISIRPKTTFQSLANLILSIAKGFSIQTDEPIRVDVMHGGTLTNAVWADVHTAESSIERDISATAISNGHLVFSTYVYAQSTGPASNQFSAADKGLLGMTVLWDRQGSHTGILSICAIRTGASDASVLASLDWEELR